MSVECQESRVQRHRRRDAGLNQIMLERTGSGSQDATPDRCGRFVAMIAPADFHRPAQSWKSGGSSPRGTPQYSSRWWHHCQGQRLFQSRLGRVIESQQNAGEFLGGSRRLGPPYSSHLETSDRPGVLVASLGKREAANFLTSARLRRVTRSASNHQPRQSIQPG